jgi:hypothetical protein
MACPKMTALRTTQIMTMIQDRKSEGDMIEVDMVQWC